MAHRSLPFVGRSQGTLIPRRWKSSAPGGCMEQYLHLKSSGEAKLIGVQSCAYHVKIRNKLPRKKLKQNDKNNTTFFFKIYFTKTWPFASGSCEWSRKETDSIHFADRTVAESHLSGEDCS